MSGQLEIATSSTLWKWVMKHEQRQPIIYFWKQFLYLYSHHHQQHQGFGLKILSVADLPSHCAPLSFQLTDTEDTFVEHFSMTCKQSGFMFCFLFQDFPLISYIAELFQFRYISVLQKKISKGQDLYSNSKSAQVCLASKLSSDKDKHQCTCSGSLPLGERARAGDLRLGSSMAV